MIVLSMSFSMFMKELDRQHVQPVRVSMNRRWAKVRVGTAVGVTEYHIPIKAVPSCIVDKNKYLPNN